MKVNKNNNIDKSRNLIIKWVFIIISIIVFAAIALYSLEKLKITDFIKLPNSQASNTTNDTNKTQEINYESPTKEQKDAGSVNKSNDNPNVINSSTINASITSIYSDSTYLHIKNVINGAITNDGKCKLTLNKNNSSEFLEKNSNTYALPSTSTCMGFDINRAELSNGAWTAKLEVTVGSNSTITIKDFTLE